LNWVQEFTLPPLTPKKQLNFCERVKIKCYAFNWRCCAKILFNERVTRRDHMEKGDLHHINDGNFNEEVLKSDLPVLVDFWAPWCGPCLSIAPAVEELAKEYSGRIKVGKMNVDENSQTPSSFGIRGIPTLILFKGGKAVNQVVGAVPKNKLKELMEESLK
jgi:thioredoxin 1